jgi:hypothetical protein
MDVNNPISYPLVWSAATRSLTSLGGALAISLGSNQSLPASTTFTLSNTASRINFVSGAVQAGAAGASQWIYNDGTSNYNLLSVNAAASNTFEMVVASGTNQVKLANGDAVNAATYCYTIASLG